MKDVCVNHADVIREILVKKQAGASGEPLAEVFRQFVKGEYGASFAALTESLASDKPKAKVDVLESLFKRASELPETDLHLLIARLEGLRLERASVAAEVDAAFGEGLESAVQPLHEIGDRPAQVAQDPADAGEARHNAAEDEARRCQRGVEWKTDQRHQPVILHRFDADRLNQEAILIAAKADIREELDRIASHVAQVREMIGKGGPVGRRLDFLAQEFNREVNTCCSKSNDLELTQTGLEMKNVVEQFREQVQNLE